MFELHARSVPGISVHAYLIKTAIPLIGSLDIRIDEPWPAIGDLAYQGGSLYRAAGNDELLVTARSLLTTAMLLAGLTIRQAKGWAASASKAC
ncbi:hypothetical protein A5892_16555 [Halotalea alkalilenta]|uniref:Uncharacterized protein n=2 Tax=Halotalea alkalilenta TaxID=376489 RepID=A0A172YI28_9GAMM|nr:hypothetical protein A5892_16555 [Halotalea alkalilenta]